MTSAEVEYDCGHKYVVPLPLADDQIMLGHGLWMDWIIAGIDTRHDEEHPECLT
jgi:hypothetical protein